MITYEMLKQAADSLSQQALQYPQYRIVSVNHFATLKILAIQYPNGTTVVRRSRYNKKKYDIQYASLPMKYIPSPQEHILAFGLRIIPAQDL